MQFIYPFFVAFLLIFISELGDKTQLLVLSFSSKTKPFFILLGVVLGSFLSHGIAILFGSSIGFLENEFLQYFFKFFTYISFILFGLFSFLPKNNKEISSSKITNKKIFLYKFLEYNLGYILFIALSIAIGELGDKTFLASLGLGFNYPNYKLFLILGAIFGMVLSDSIALILGKMLNHYISESAMQKFSGILFLILGILGFFKFFIKF